MKLEVGMYARLHGKIGKIEHICMCEQCKLRGFYEPVVDFGHEGSDYVSVYWKDDLKASNNIIDLIEVGDIITYEFPTGLGMLKYENVTVLEELLNILKSSDEYTILSIVTKEQFESMQYKVD